MLLYNLGSDEYMWLCILSLNILYVTNLRENVYTFRGGNSVRIVISSLLYKILFW